MTERMSFPCMRKFIASEFFFQPLYYRTYQSLKYLKCTGVTAREQTTICGHDGSTATNKEDYCENCSI